MSEMSSGNSFNETEENISITIQPFISKPESILDLKLLIELVRQSPGILNPKLNCFKDYA